jgi:hypothetical protein
MQNAKSFSATLNGYLQYTPTFQLAAQKETVFLLSSGLELCEFFKAK